MTNTTWGRAAFAAGPLCMGAYGLVRLIDDDHGPGPDWSIGHLALLAGVLLFVPVFVGLRGAAARGSGPAGRWFAGTGAVLGLLGVAAVTGQAVIDLVVGYCSADRATMDELFDRIQGGPGIGPAFYTVGPLLFHVGLVLLTAQAAVVRAVAAWRPVAVVAATALTAVSLDLLPLGALLFLLALAPLGEPSGRGAAAPVRRTELSVRRTGDEGGPAPVLVLAQQPSAQSHQRAGQQS
ncbi:hypothetical protein AB0F13_09990 [Streptomyces sp. NPDC026206]|uniref:hypothetical protein n=1 Tax=Streptomyces sp. NPDC026206 TaxID=3157089 RepID=UPI0033D84BC3